MLMIAFLLLHFWSLPWYPFVHSDEAWLASLSRTIWSGDGASSMRLPNPAATEEFFRLTPRYPHALKTAYHGIQGPLVSRWWTAEAARLPSLLAGLLSVVFLGKVLRRLTGAVLPAFILTAAFALDPQVFYISHLARQEAAIMAFMLAAVWVLVRAGTRKRASLVPPFTAALLLGGAIFVHPNAFIAAAATLPWVLYTTHKRGRLRSVLLYIAVLGVMALLALGASVLMDPDFFANYRAFGESLGVSANPVQRWARLREYFHKMIRRHAGTYYLPPVTLQLSALLIFSAIALALSCWKGCRFGRRSSLAAATSALATVTAIFMIGKYSPPGTVFLHPWIYLLAGILNGALWNAGFHTAGNGKTAPSTVRQVTLPVLMAVAMAISLGTELARWYPGAVEGNHYRRYIARIRRSIPPGEVALANLNSAFAFAPGELRVWRDLGALPPRENTLLDSPFGRFLQTEQIRWVVLSREELEMIYRERPVWNDLYGNPHRFFPVLEEILRTWGTRVDRFESPWYGMRLVPFMNRGPHHVEIYRLDLPALPEAPP